MKDKKCKIEISVDLAVKLTSDVALKVARHGYKWSSNFEDELETQYGTDEFYEAVKELRQILEDK